MGPPPFKERVYGVGADPPTGADRARAPQKNSLVRYGMHCQKEKEPQERAQVLFFLSAVHAIPYQRIFIAPWLGRRSSTNFYSALAEVGALHRFLASLPGRRRLSHALFGGVGSSRSWHRLGGPTVPHRTAHRVPQSWGLPRSKPAGRLGCETTDGDLE